MELLYKELTGRILGVAMEVHHELGCGFLEALYQEAFEHELKLNRISFASQKPHRVAYKDIILQHPYIPDLIVERENCVGSEGYSGNWRDGRSADDQLLEDYDVAGRFNYQLCWSVIGMETFGIKSNLVCRFKKSA